jgi:hypothetical protein
MFGWLKRKAQIASVNAMATDIDRFVMGLRGASAEEIGGILASTYHWMEFLERKFGWNLDHPDLVIANDLFASMTVGKCARRIQGKEPAMATGLMVWLHTLRASGTPELRLRGRELWSQLNRGAEHVQRGAGMFKTMIGLELDLRCQGRVPRNLGGLESEAGKPSAQSRSSDHKPADHKPTTSPERIDDDLHKSADLLATQLRAQMIFLSLSNKAFPADDFSAGYVFGTVDAYLQANGATESDVRSISLMSLVYLQLYGHPHAGGLLGRVLDHQTVEGAVKAGIQAGGSDMWEYLRVLRYEHTKIPMGLALHHMDTRAA